MSILKNQESCSNCIHKNVCKYKTEYAQLVINLREDVLQPLIVSCKYFETGKIERAEFR